jgi:hypothetical protein
MAADSLTSDIDNGSLFTRSEPKIAWIKDVAVAWVGSVSGCLEIIDHLSKYPTMRTIADVRAGVRGLSPVDGKICFLVVACSDGIATIDHELTVSTPYLEYCAVGFGGSAANGSLFSTVGMPAEDRLSIALRAAEAHNTTVRGPFGILRVPRDPISD